jgi:predicted DNA-binding transcriptional regulator AlpA
MDAKDQEWVNEELTLISASELAARFGINVSTLERRYMTAPDFPRPVRLSDQPREPRRFLLKEVLGYMQGRLAARDE